jgi:hypothetical protein
VFSIDSEPIDAPLARLRTLTLNYAKVDNAVSILDRMMLFLAATIAPIAKDIGQCAGVRGSR